MDQSKFLGSGSYGNVYILDDFTVVKQLLDPTPTWKEDLHAVQRVVNQCDRYRNILGSEIVAYRQQGQKKLVYMVRQGVSLEKLKGIDERHLKSFRHLIEGVMMLSKKGHAHGDIKRENCTWDETNGRMKIIDHGFLNKEPNRLNPLINGSFYYVWPPEIWRKKYHPPQFPLRGMQDHLHRDLIRYFERDGRNWWIDAFRQRYPPRYPPQEQDVAVFDPHINIRKLDVYSLGIMAMELFYIDFPETRPIIHLMIHPDPTKRLSPTEALLFWNEMLKKLGLIRGKVRSDIQIIDPATEPVVMDPSVPSSVPSSIPVAVGGGGGPAPVRKSSSQKRPSVRTMISIWDDHWGA